VYEKFVNDSLSIKITADRISYNSKLNDYSLFNFMQRTVGYTNDVIEKIPQKRIKFNFEPDDLAPVIYIAETMNLGELHQFIKKEQERGGQNINTYLVVYYRKFSAPVAAFILTIIAVAVASFKRRGGMGINLAIGIVIAFTFIFFDKIFGTMAEKSDISPLVAVWLPNVVFGILAFYLLKNAKQ
jgi:lipopolysaccharide export system permease protein